MWRANMEQFLVTWQAKVKTEIIRVAAEDGLQAEEIADRQIRKSLDISAYEITSVLRVPDTVLRGGQ